MTYDSADGMSSICEPSYGVKPDDEGLPSKKWTLNQLRKLAYLAYYDGQTSFTVSRRLLYAGYVYGFITTHPATGEDVFAGRIVLLAQEDDTNGQ